MLTKQLWSASRWLYKLEKPRTAKTLKGLNFLLNRCLLPSQAEVGQGLLLEHHGFGVVVHPNTTIGSQVRIWHNVTIAAETRPGSNARVVIGDNVMIGTGAIIIARAGQGLSVGRDAIIAAGATVTRDVPSGSVVAGPKAQILNNPASGLPDNNEGWD